MVKDVVDAFMSIVVVVFVAPMSLFVDVIRPYVLHFKGPVLCYPEENTVPLWAVPWWKAIAHCLLQLLCFVLLFLWWVFLFILTTVAISRILPG